MRKELFEELLQSVQEMREIQRGKRRPARATSAKEVFQRDVQNVAALRSHFGLSQSKFAAMLGISVDTLQNWEQGRRQPDGPARVLLRVAATAPEALLAVSATAARKR